MRAPDDNRSSGIDSIDKQDIKGGYANTNEGNTTCRKGKMRISGKEYLVDCDGQLVEFYSR